MSEIDNLTDALRNALALKKQASKKKEWPLIHYNTFDNFERKLLVDFCHEVPNKFLEEISSKTSKLFKTQDPPDLSSLTGLSKEIWDKFLSLKQTDQQFADKMRLWNTLNNLIKGELSNYGLFMAGSTLNGFGLQDSDIDLSLVTGTPANELNSTDKHLEKLVTVLKKCDTLNAFEKINARVPLVRFYDAKYKVKVDVNFNVASNIQNTHLLHCYSQVDWRVSPLVTIVKKWAKTHEILDAKYGSLSSYPLVLMVIHFLQAGVQPKILPSLQKCLKGKFNSTVKSIDYFNRFEVPFTELYPLNKQSLGELLLQFFEYYDKFEFQKYVISILEAKKILRSEYNTEPLLMGTACMYIQEPFNFSNVSGTVYKPPTFEKISSMIKKTYLQLKRTHKLSDIMDQSLSSEI